MAARLLHIAVLTALLFSGSIDVAAAAKKPAATSAPGVSAQLWRNKAHRRWLQRFRQELQQNLRALQQQEALGSANAERRRQEMVRRAQQDMNDVIAAQQRLQAQLSAQETARQQSCIARCLAPSPCGPGQAGVPASSCPNAPLQCQTQCR
jgi:hypothetical protein